MTFATIKHGADAIGKQAQIAHDLQKVNDPDYGRVLAQMVTDCKTLLEQAEQLHDQCYNADPRMRYAEND